MNIETIEVIYISYIFISVKPFGCIPWYTSV